MAKQPSAEANEKKDRDGKPRPSRGPGKVPVPPSEEPRILGEICVEELAIDGICGVY